MSRPLTNNNEEDEHAGGRWSTVSSTIWRLLHRAGQKIRDAFIQTGGCWSATQRFVHQAWQRISDAYTQTADDDGVRLSVEETEPARLQSSVCPFYSGYTTQDL
ncbi:uncharacterized protein Hap1MRO34_002993 isoform 1-T1 [Clarias gariepinus]